MLLNYTSTQPQVNRPCLLARYAFKSCRQTMANTASHKLLVTTWHPPLFSLDQVVIERTANRAHSRRTHRGSAESGANCCGAGDSSASSHHHTPQRHAHPAQQHRGQRPCAVHASPTCRDVHEERTRCACAHVSPKGGRRVPAAGALLLSFSIISTVRHTATLYFVPIVWTRCCPMPSITQG